MKTLISHFLRHLSDGGRLLGGLLGAGVLAAAAQTTVYDSGGFESPVFLLEQGLDGQDPGKPLGNGPWAQDGGTSRAVVTAINPIDGTKAVKVTRNPGATGDTRWGVVKPTVPTGTNNVVDIRFDMKVVQRPGEYGPLFGVEAYDYAYGKPVLIGTLLHDASTGELLYRKAGTGEAVGTGYFPDLVVHHHYRLSLNFTAKTYSLFVDESLVRTEGFVSPLASAFYDAPVVTLSAGGDDDTGIAYFDNYRVVHTTSLLPYLVWKGDGAGNVWQEGPVANWHDGIGPTSFANGKDVRFTDLGSSAPAIDLQGSLLPASVIVSTSQDYEFAGAGSIGGATGLRKDGEGTLTLSTANGYTGDTRVLAGELSVRNASHSATGSGTVTVAGMSILSGNGTIAGPVETAPGAVIEPGVGIGTLSFGSSVVFDNAILKFELGSNSDRIAVAGDLTLSGTIDVSEASGFGPATYPLITYGGGLIRGNLVLTGTSEDYIYELSTATAGVVALIVAPLPPPPGTPSALAATPAGKYEIALAWTDLSDNEDRFVIERSADGISFSVIGASGANEPTYFDSGLSSGKTYFYRILAGNRGGKSGYSNIASARTNISPPVAYLTFDETSGSTAADSSPNGNDATLMGEPLWTSGQFGNAIDLDGVDDHATLPAGIVADVDEFTIATWVKLDSLSPWSRIFDFGVNTSTYMFLTPSNGATGTVRFAISTSSGAGEQKINGSSPLPTGQWTHVAVTRSGSLGTLYVNGIAVGTNDGLSLSPASLGATGNNYIGKSQYPDPYLNGQIDDFQIHDRALSTEEIAALANTSSPRPPTGLVAVEESNQVRLSWNAVDGATSYSVYRSMGDGSGYILVANGLTSPAFTDANLANGTTYSYVVTASNAAGESGFSAVLEATPQYQAIFSGRAYVVGLNVLGLNATWQDTGELPSEGGSAEVSFQSIDESGVVAGEIGHAFVFGQADRTRSEASVSELVIDAAGVIIEADFAMSRALAVYQPGGGTAVAGGAEIGELVIAGI